MSSFLDVQRHGRVLELVLNRPDKRNALNVELCTEIVNQCAAASGDDTIGSIYLRAAGAMFSAGFDLDASGEIADPANAEVLAKLFALGESLRKPLVCAVQGPALGAGLGLVANSHIAIAVHGTTFGLTEIRLGTWPFASYRAVERALGSRRTLELALSSKIFNTPEALSWGLVQEVVPPFELEERAEAIAHAVANASATAIAMGLEFVSRQQPMPAGDAIEQQSQSLRSLDYEEGTKAVREKRAPRWPSHP